MNRAELIEIIGNGENSGVEFKLDDIRPEQLAKEVAVISFPQGISKPYVVRRKGREDVYIRVGSTSRLATREQQARLFAMGGMFHTELMPVPGSSISSLDRVRLENYLKDIIQDPEIPQSDQEWAQRLLGLGFLVEGPDANPICTVAGLQMQLLNALKKKPSADYATLARILDVSPATVKRNIQKLKNIGALKRIGSKKTGYWEVIG